MALTRNFKETVQARVLADPAFREALLREGIEARRDRRRRGRPGCRALGRQSRPRRRSRVIALLGGARPLLRGADVLQQPGRSLTLAAARAWQNHRSGRPIEN